MRRSNLYVNRLEGQVYFSYNQYRLHLPENYIAENQHFFAVFLTALPKQEKEGGQVQGIDGVARYGALLRITIVSPVKDKGKEGMNVYVGMVFARVKIINLKKQNNVQRATVQILSEDLPQNFQTSPEGKQLNSNLKKELKLYYQCVQGKIESERSCERLDAENISLKMVYQAINQMNVPIRVKLRFLQTECFREKIEKIINLLKAKTEGSKDIMAIQASVRSVVDTKHNQTPLSQGKRKTPSEEMAAKMAEKGVPPHVRKQIEREMRDMGGEEDREVAQKYIDTLMEFPWTQYTPEAKDIVLAQSILQQEHTGMKAVKQRILQHIAVRFRNGNSKGNVICLHGPPGVGKTSIAKSIAKALGKKFVKIALGGVGDQAQMRGHRRTYTGAMPGRIIRALMQAGSSNPLILLDQIDKMGNSRSDPEHALLQVLDPSQNSSFVDHYVAFPVDLSKVMFVCTANSLQLSKPLLDRFQAIEVPGYSRQEKADIARSHLIPQQVRENGVEGLVEFNSSAIDAMVARSNQPGVRSLQRNIAKVCRRVARANRHEVITKERVDDILGEKRKGQLWSGVGVAHCLAGNEYGGRVLTVEAVRFPSATQQLVVTGQLGSVMRESVDVALSCIRGNFQEIQPLVNSPKLLEDLSIHLHFPQGATKKDGASAGLPIFVSLLSVVMKTAPREGLAMAGEITLGGRVLPIQGVRQKCMAAIHQGIQLIVLPEGNLRELNTLDPQLRKQAIFHTIRDIKQILPLAFPILHHKRMAKL